MGWAEEIVAQGIRRPGYPADDWIEGWARDHFVALGLEEVTLDPVEVDRWEPLRWSLTVWHPETPNETLTIPCYAVPFSGNTSPDGVTGELEVFSTPEGEEPEDLTGKIAIVENEFLALPQSVMRALFARWEYDPEGAFDNLVQTLPFSGAFQDAMGPSIEAGAIGFLGILRGLPWETDQYYVPYDALERPIPGAWLSSSNGDRLLQFLEEGPAEGRLVLERDLQKATSHNVTGVLRGASDEWIIIGSHHDGPWASAVEDASGVALVLAQAKYWSQVPQRKRPHNLMFLLNGGHMSGGAGLHHFVNTNRAFLERDVVVEVHLEHAAREARGEDGRLVPTDAPEVRWWFTSFMPPLEEAVADAICAEELGRSFLMPVEGFPPGSMNPPTDAAFFHPWSPIVSFLTAPMYLFDAQDTIDKIHEPSLVPLTRAAIRIINDMHDESAASLRSTLYVPPRTETLAPCSER
ncbi:MAG: M28 family peptidase [Deltaproteobacteria bacterium]|nr:M28 family peptidase [Deltaproteobacteria bacterium]